MNPKIKKLLACETREEINLDILNYDYTREEVEFILKKLIDLKFDMREMIRYKCIGKNVKTFITTLNDNGYDEYIIGEIILQGSKNEAFIEIIFDYVNMIIENHNN